MTTSDNWFKEFEFDLLSSLLRDLVTLLGGMGRATLDGTNVSNVPEEQGVYQLFLDDLLVYVGKTDSEAGLNKRLARHAKKIQHRHNLDPNRVSFRAVRIYVLTAVDLEQQLIKHYQETEDIPLAWNQSGFGANDPGRERDTTKLKDTHFDLLYAINIDVPIGVSEVVGNFPVSDVLTRLKAALPYTLRFQNAGGRSKKPHADLLSTRINVPGGMNTTRDILRLVQIALGMEWQITILPGYIIVYKESATYPHTQLL